MAPLHGRTQLRPTRPGQFFAHIRTDDYFIRSYTAQQVFFGIDLVLHAPLKAFGLE